MDEVMTSGCYVLCIFPGFDIGVGTKWEIGSGWIRGTECNA